MRIRSLLAAATAFGLMACGSSSTAHITSSHSPSANAGTSASPPTSTPGAVFPSPTPGPAGVPAAVSTSCTSAPAAGEHLVLVSLRGVSGIVVRDITDINHPVNRCKVSGGGYFRFVSATRLSYIVLASSDLGAAGAMYLVDMSSGTTSLVRSWTYSGYASWIYAWSPDGSHLSYLSSDQTSLQWHMLSAAGDRTLADLGPVAARGVNLDVDDAMVGFSADGQYVAIEQTFTQGNASAVGTPIQVNRVSDAGIAYSRTDGTMAAWAGTGARLLFRTSAGIQSWSPAAGVISVSSAVWIHPVASPDGSRMAFSVLSAQGNHVGNVLDLTTGAIHGLSSEPRVGAAFLNASLVWYAGETICTTATPCGLGGPPLSGKTYVYDLGSDVEAGSLDTAFYDSWPHVVGES
jgi:hypothetical protein